MTFPKKTLFALALTMAITIAIIISAYIARIPLIAHIIKAELSVYQANVSCLDFHLTTDLNLAISRLCLKVPQAEVNIEDMLITWQSSAKQIVTDIDIASATIKGTASLFNNTADTAKQSKQESIIAQLKSYTRLLAEVELPNITLNKLHYLPFYAENIEKAVNAKLIDMPHYFARLAVKNNNIDLTLTQQSQTPFLMAKLARLPSQSQQFNIDISGQLTPLQTLILNHNLPLPTLITNTLANAKTQGKLTAIASYKNEVLALDTHLQDFSLASTEGIQSSGPFEFFGELYTKSKINLIEQQTAENNTELEVQFQPASQLTLDYSQQHLLAYLANKDLPPMLSTVINDNPISQLALKPKGKLTYQLNNQQIALTGVDLTARSTEQTQPLSHQQSHQQSQQLSVDNIVVELSRYLSDTTEKMAKNENVQTPAQLEFTLTSSIVLSALNNFTREPISLNLQGSIKQTRTQTQDLNNTQGKTVTTITFDQGSAVNGHNIAIAKAKKSTNKKLTTQKLLSVKQLTTALHGDIQIQESIQEIAQGKDQLTSPNKPAIKPAIKLNLTTESLAKRFIAANMVEVKSLALKADISGDLENIVINALANADNVPLGHLTVSGAMTQPKVSVSAKALQLTDLLSLNIKLPVEVALVEGALSYSVNGQVMDLANIENTPFVISVAVTSLSGDIDKIWIQELNWQQNFNFVSGKLTTTEDLALGSKENPVENLTVALIDTATPISKLAIRTALSYQQEFKISAKNLSANVLGGSFAIPQIQWPISHEHSVDVQLSSIDLEQVLALDKKQGIVVTGDISGHLPVRFDGKKFTMEKGQLHNVSNGLIQVKDNPAVEELKANNNQLKLAFDALQNLHYHQLSSDVSMADDGYMLLETVIKGRNPDIDNDVNLNLNLSYDLLGLLESLSITDKFEKSIIKGLQKQ